MSDNSNQPSLSYKDAGVNIDAGNALVERIKGVSRRTARPEVLGGLGGFGALCEMPGVRGAPYLASRGMTWVQADGKDGLGDAVLRAQLKDSYRLVARGLTKKKQKELGLELEPTS